MDETRELKIKLTLEREEWEDLERYAKNEGKSCDDYLEQYMRLGVLTALREGYIFHASQNKSKFQLAAEFCCTSECPEYAAGTCTYDILTNQNCPRIREALEGDSRSPIFSIFQFT